MAEIAESAVEFEAFRQQVRRELDDIRREIQDLRQVVAAMQPAPRRPHTPEEIEASMARLRKLREDILRDRGGELLPPVADDINRAREERTAQILAWPSPRTLAGSSGPPTAT